jgi:ABC-2 type transport system ATP-binding protein
MTISDPAGYAVASTGLTKRYGSLAAVDGVDLRVRQGEIYAFLGLNGAGKTTTIRMLLGMVRPTAGAASVFGQRIEAGTSGPWRDVGYLVETPSAYPQLTVVENLEIFRRLRNLPERGSVSRIMDRLGLSGYARRKAGTLSTGNMQRLGLARALIHSPRLLILDEPANGLDPAGVVEIRELLRSLAQGSGVTIFMSSHILTEVDRLASRIGIIHRGRLVEELDADRLEGLRARRLEVGARDLERAASALRLAGYSPRLESTSLTLVEPRAIGSPEDVARVLVEANASPTRLAVVQEDLEDHFLRLVGGAG